MLWSSVGVLLLSRIQYMTGKIGNVVLFCQPIRSEDLGSAARTLVTPILRILTGCQKNAQIAKNNKKKSDVKILLVLTLMAVVCGGAFHTFTARSQYIDAALLSEAFALTSPIKQSVADYYLQNGAMPHSNEDAGLAAPNSIFGTSVKRIAINQGGVLRVDFDEEVGKTAMVFSPTAAMSGGFLSWRCTSDSIEVAILKKLRPMCNSLPLTKESQLMAAIANGSLDKINRAIADGANLNAVVNGNTALMLAAKLGDTTIINRLIDENADVNHFGVNAARRTPLMVAITGNRAEAVSTLLSRGASVLSTDYRGNSVLDHAKNTDLRLGGERYVLMVSARLNPNFAGKGGDSSFVSRPTDEAKRLRLLYVELRSAAHECHTPRLSRLLFNEKALPKDGVIAGKPMKSYVAKPQCALVLTEYVESLSVYERALHARLSSAMHQCNSEEVRILLRDNPSVDVLNEDGDGGPVFEQAVFAGCADLVSTLIREKSLGGKLSGGLLPDVIKRAPQDTLVRLISSLIESGVDVNAVSESGYTALSTAIIAGQPVVAKYLIDAGADVNTQTPGGSFPLIEATKKGYTQLVSRLLEAEAEINSVDSFGRPAIIAAVVQNKVRLVDLLLRFGANPHLGDKDGISALILAENSNQRAIQSLITSSASND